MKKKIKNMNAKITNNCHKKKTCRKSEKTLQPMKILQFYQKLSVMKFIRICKRAESQQQITKKISKISAGKNHTPET